MKKFMRATAVILCLACFLGGCGKKQEETGSNGKEKITWTAWLGAPVNKNAEMIKYWDEQFDVDIDVWNIEASNYMEAISLKVSGGEIPDVFYLPSESLYTKYAKDGLLAELTEEKIKEYAPNMYAEYKEADERAFSYSKVGGKIYGIPALGGVHRRPLAYRGDWMEKVGVTETPETLDEFEKLLYKFANDDPDGNGEKDTYGISSSGIYAVYGAFGLVPEYWLEDENGKLVYGGVQPKMKEALGVLRKWYADGVLDPEFIVTEKQNASSNMSTPFVNGRIGFTSNGEEWHFKPKFDNSAEAADWEGDNVKELRKIDSHAADSIKLGRPIEGPHGDKGIGGFGEIGNGTMLAFGVQLEKNEAKLKKVFNIIETIGFSSYENKLTAQNGIKGKHWDFNDKKQIVYLDEKYQKYTERAKIGAHTVMTTLSSQKWNDIGNEAMAEWNEKNHAFEGSIENKLKTVLESETLYSVELDKLRSEAYIAIITGEKDLDYFDKFVSEWKKGGGDQLTKEANEWYKGIK